MEQLNSLSDIPNFNQKRQKLLSILKSFEKNGYLIELTGRCFRKPKKIGYEYFLELKNLQTNEKRIVNMHPLYFNENNPYRNHTDKSRINKIKQIIDSINKKGNNISFSPLFFKKNSITYIKIINKETNEEKNLRYNDFILRKKTPWPQISVCGSSTGEASSIDFFNRLFNKDFKKVRPNWLINPKTNLSLELDGYNESLKIAIEYGSHKQIHHKATYFKDEKYIQYKDAIKKELCKKNGVKLIHIPDLPLYKKDIDAIFKKIVLKEFKRLKINPPKNFDKIIFNIKEIAGAYSKESVWITAKKCKNREDFERNYKGYFRAAERLGIINDIIKHFREKKSKEFPLYFLEKNLENAKKIALKCKTKTEFHQKYCSFYKWAAKEGILDTLCKHMELKEKPKGYWQNKENIINEIKLNKKNKKTYNELSAQCLNAIRIMNLKEYALKILNN